MSANGLKPTNRNLGFQPKWCRIGCSNSKAVGSHATVGLHVASRQGSRAHLPCLVPPRLAAGRGILLPATCRLPPWRQGLSPPRVAAPRLDCSVLAIRPRSDFFVNSVELVVLFNKKSSAAGNKKFGGVSVLEATLKRTASAIRRAAPQP